MSDNYIHLILVDMIFIGEYAEYNWDDFNKYINNSDMTYISELYTEDVTYIFLSNRKLTDEELFELNIAGITSLPRKEFEAYDGFGDFLLNKVKEEKHRYDKRVEKYGME